MTTLGALPARLVRRISAELHKSRLERDFARLMRDVDAAPGDGPKIGLATFGSGEWHLAIELLLAHALRIRGARPELLICDLPDLPICAERLITSTSRERCSTCVEGKRHLLETSGLPWRGLGTLISPGAVTDARAAVEQAETADLTAFSCRGWPIGQWLHVSGCHHLRCDERGNAPEKVDTRRRLLATAMVIVEAVERWLDTVAPQIVLVQGGAHLAWRIARELAQARGIPVYSREMGKGGWDRHIYALDADCMAPNLTEEWQDARHAPLTPSEEQEVDALVAQLPADTYTAIVSPRDGNLTLPAGKKIAVAFTNVTWDLATAGRDVGFGGVLDWLRETIAALQRHPDVHLVIRAHPAEASVKTRERILEQIAFEWPGGWPGVTLIEPEQAVSANQLFAAADLVLAYNSTAGLEAAIAGRPVLLCGDPHFRGKGFTIDVASRDEYVRLLDGWAAGTPVPAPVMAVALARRYFHLFFARYHVAMGWTTSPIDPPYCLTIESIDDLKPGRNASLDLVCDSMLAGRAVVRPRARTEDAACAR